VDLTTDLTGRSPAGSPTCRLLNLRVHSRGAPSQARETGGPLPGRARADRSECLRFVDLTTDLTHGLWRSYGSGVIAHHGLTLALGAVIA
jgi:hypothetical protein